MAGLTNYQMDILASEIHERMKTKHSLLNNESLIIDKIKKDIKYAAIEKLIKEYETIQKHINNFQIKAREISVEIREITKDNNFYNYNEKGLNQYLESKLNVELQNHIPSINKIKSTLVTNTLEKISIKVDDVIDQLSN